MISLDINQLEPVSLENQNRRKLDHHIIQLLRANRVEGLSMFYDQYAKILFGVIYRIVPQLESAEEVLQDVILKVWKNFHQFDTERGDLLAWAINIARNAAIDRRRLKKINRKNEDISPMSEILQTKGLNPDTIGIKELTEGLDPKQREIVDLVYFNGYTQSETAKELEIPLGTVKTRLRKAINKLRDLFDLE